MSIEKLPKEYDRGKFQKIIEGLGQKLGMSEKKQNQALIDLSTEMNAALADQKKELEERVGGEEGKTHLPRTLPVPQDLTVKQLFGFIICHVKPFAFFKYLVAGVKGYEFYGDYNSGFTVRQDDYAQTGVHYGVDDSTFLLTQDTSTPANSFIIDPRVIKTDFLTLENMTQGTSGPIIAASYTGNYKLVVSGVTWDTGDTWRIKNYPSNKLMSIGPWSMFIKSFRTLNLDFYVKVRTVGIGNSFSAFAEGDTTSATDEIPAPLNLSATIRTRLLSRNNVYWVQDIPYIDIVLEWDNLGSEYGFLTYEIREPRPGEED